MKEGAKTSKMSPDEQLMIQVKNGHIDKMSGLFERYHIAIYNYFRKMQLDKGLSEDLTQTVFERALKYRHTFQNEYVFRPWLYRIASNVRNDHFRGLKKEREKEEHIKKSLLSNSYTIDDHSSDRKEYLKLALKKLDPDQRELIYLTKYENMKYAEVGALLGYSESNVKVKIFRAMKSLKNHYFKIDKNATRG
jgi:RNA polymerase sigma-70 factor (ECF subfamily)